MSDLADRLLRLSRPSNAEPTFRGGCKDGCKLSAPTPRQQLESVEKALVKAPDDPSVRKALMGVRTLLASHM